MGPSSGHHAYQHSPVEEDEIRLVVLLPSTAMTDPIRCRIISTKDFNAAYEAVSYTWRNPDLSWADIELNGRPYSVPDNLQAALKCLRLHDLERVLWIDLVCINQENIEEKCQQVSIMRQIFERAFGVCIWLGEGDESSRMAMQFIRKLDLIPDLDSLLRDSNYEEYWRALIRLISLPWFSRIWVVQEVAVARKAIIWCGADFIDWRQLQTVIALLHHKSQLSMLYRPIMESGASRLVNIVDRVFQRGELGEIQRPTLSLETLVTNLSTFRSADPRDRIFALLGLAKDTGTWPSEDTSRVMTGQPITVDYTKDFRRLCDQFIHFAVSKSGSLDILFRPWAPSDEHTALSSWICTLDRLAFDVHNENGWPEAIRVNPDPFVNSSGESSTYNASGKFRAEDQGLFASSQYDYDSRCLRVRGKIVDSIDAITTPAWDGNMPVEWLKFGAGPKDSSAVSDELWSTLVAGRGPQGSDCPTYYSKALAATIHGIGDSKTVEADKIIREEKGSIKSEFWGRAQAVIWNRSLVKTKQGRLGLTPAHAEADDLVCILYGCSVPVLLRQHRDGEYRLVGESYIFGIMEGEALHNQGTDATWFNIEATRLSSTPFVEPVHGHSIAPQTQNIFGSQTNPASIPSQLEIVHKQFRLRWTCSCGYTGIDTFMEYRAGGIDDLTRRLEAAGVSVSLEELGLLDPFLDAIKMLVVHLRIFFANNTIQLTRSLRYFTRDPVDINLADIPQNRAGDQSLAGTSKVSPLRASKTTAAKGPSSSSSRPSQLSSIGDISLQPISGVTPGASITTGTRTPPLTDYILLCINDSSLLITRDDLALSPAGGSPVVSDQQLFTCLRARYFSRRNWIRRLLALKSVHNISFVRFVLHENQEVDDLRPNQVPFATDRHYSFMPRPPGVVPPFSSSFLTHRFKDPGFCRDSTVCLDQLPKRIQRRPERGIPPDMFIGWGLYLQDGYSVRRICFWGLLGFVISLAFGIYRSINNGSISDGFAVAAYILAFEAMTLATVQFAAGLVKPI